MRSTLHLQIEGPEEVQGAARDYAHPGEMARLLGTTVAEVQSNRVEVARSFAKKHGVTVF